MGPFGILEIILLLIVGILVFGGDLPEVGRKIGRIWGRIQRYITLLQQDIDQETSTIQEQIDLEDAEHEPYVSRQQSPETKTPEEYKTAEEDVSDTVETVPSEYEREPLGEQEHETEEKEEDVRTLREEIEAREEDDSEEAERDSPDAEDEQ